MVETAQMTKTGKWYSTEAFPIYFIQGERIFLKFESPTDLMQLYGQDYGNGRYEWFSSRAETPPAFLEGLADNPSYRRITAEAFEQEEKRYLEFHKKLCA